MNGNHHEKVALDHVSLPVKRLAAARKFYERALGAIGMHVNMDLDDAFGMGSEDEKIFWVVRDKGAGGEAHHAFRVATKRDVEAFYRAALRAGGEDNGPPGLRPRYGAGYYAAFVRDAEGNNIEVVCYGAQPRVRRPKRARRGVGPARPSRRRPDRADS